MGIVNRMLRLKTEKFYDIFFFSQRWYQQAFTFPPPLESLASYHWAVGEINGGLLMTTRDGEEDGEIKFSVGLLWKATLMARGFLSFCLLLWKITQRKTLNLSIYYGKSYPRGGASIPRLITDCLICIFLPLCGWRLSALAFSLHNDECLQSLRMFLGQTQVLSSHAAVWVYNYEDFSAFYATTLMLLFAMLWIENSCLAYSVRSLSLQSELDE